MTTAAVLLVIVLGGAFALGFGALWGLVHGWVWSLVHGPDRTRQAARILAGLVACIQLLVVGLVLATTPDAAAATAAGVAYGAFLVPYALGVFLVLRRPPAAVEVAPSPPSFVQPDHDGVTFEVPSRAALGSALATAGAIAAPLPLAFAAMAWSRRWSRTPVRVRNDAIDVDGRQLPLHGAVLADAVRWDGTPLLRITTSTGVADIPIGGTPAGEVRWTREILAEAIRGAEDTRLPPEPEALRRLAERTRARVEGTEP